MSDFVVSPGSKADADQIPSWIVPLYPDLCNA